MIGTSRSIVSTVLLGLIVFSMASAADSKQYEGTWKSELDYDGVLYTLELTLTPAEGGKYEGNLRVLDADYLVETVGFKSVKMSGDSLIVVTNPVDGRSARFALTSGEEKLAGLFWEISYSGTAQGQGLKMEFKKAEKLMQQK